MAQLSNFLLPRRSPWEIFSPYLISLFVSSFGPPPSLSNYSSKFIRSSRHRNLWAPDFICGLFRDKMISDAKLESTWAFVVGPVCWLLGQVERHLLRHERGAIGCAWWRSTLTRMRSWKYSIQSLAIIQQECYHSSGWWVQQSSLTTCPPEAVWCDVQVELFWNPSAWAGGSSMLRFPSRILWILFDSRVRPVDAGELLLIG